MSLDRLKREYEKSDNFDFLSFPSFGSYITSFLSNDLNDPAICFKRAQHEFNVSFQIKIRNNTYDILSSCFSNITSNCEIVIDDDIDLQDLELLSPLFQGKEFCVCLSNLQLFGVISKFLKDDDLLKIYNFIDDLFSQIDILFDLHELEEAIFDFDLNYFINFKEKDENGITIKLKKFDKNYIARFIYELGCSKPVISKKIAKYASDICNIIDSKEYPKEQNEKSLRDTISEYFLLKLKNPDGFKIHNYLYRQFFDHNLIDKDELLETIFSTVDITIKNCKCLLWFLDILPSHMKQVMEDLMCEINIKQYEHDKVYIDKLIANDFQLFKLIVSEAESNNPIANAIRNDQVDQLQALLIQRRSAGQSSDPNIKLGEMLFVVNELANNTTLLDYAAFFGSIKCFKYLLLNGAEFQRDTFHYAITGQNAEILHIIQQKNTIKSNSLCFSVEVNSNNVFDWLYDTVPLKKNEEINDITCESISHYNFHVFLKTINKIGNFSRLKADAIRSGNYEVLKFLNMISIDSPSTIIFFDFITYSVIMKNKYKMKWCPPHLKKNQIAQSNELFQIYYEYLKTISFSKNQLTNKLNEWFLEVVKDKNYFAIKYLFNQFDFTDFINNFEIGFLRNEVVERNMSAALYLIIQKKNININATPKGRSGTAFTLAAWDGKFACARILYNRGGVDINAIGNVGETPLTGCILSERPDIAKILISFKDIDVNKPNVENRTPFQLACNIGKYSHEMVKVLLMRKDINVEMELIKKQFQKAFLANHIDLMEAIYSHPNVDFNQINIDQLFKGKNLNEVNIKTIMVLSQMLAPDDKLSFQKLVLRISDPILYSALLDSDKSLMSQYFDQKDVYPYYHAIKANKQETIEYLLQFSNIDVNAIYPKKQITPLLQVIMTKAENFGIFKLLLSCDRLDISANEAIVGGEDSFLNLFLRNGKEKELYLYAETKIKKSQKNISDDFILFLINNNLFDLVKLSIENGYRGEMINQALFESIKRNKIRSNNTDGSLLYNLGLFNILLDFHTKNEIFIDFNYRSINDDGRTPLMESIYCNQKAAFDSLLEKIDNIDFNIKDNNKMTAYDHAEQIFISENNDHFFNRFVQGRLISLSESSFSNQSLSRINLILEFKNNFIFSSILTGFSKQELLSICNKIDMQLIIDNIEHFRSKTLLVFIDVAKHRIFEKVNDGDSSFIYQLIKYYIIKANDETINFKDTKVLEMFTKLGFDINSIDKNGETILMHSIKNQNFEAFLTLLLFDDIKLTIKNKEGKDSSQFARDLGHFSVAKTIEKMIHNGHE